AVRCGLWCCEGEAGSLALAALASPPVPLSVLRRGGTAEARRAPRASHGSGTPQSTEPTTTSPDPRPSRRADPVYGSICVHLRNLRNLRSTTLVQPGPPSRRATHPGTGAGAGARPCNIRLPRRALARPPRNDPHGVHLRNPLSSIMRFTRYTRHSPEPATHGRRRRPLLQPHTCVLALTHLHPPLPRTRRRGQSPGSPRPALRLPAPVRIRRRRSVLGQLRRDGRGRPLPRITSRRHPP